MRYKSANPVILLAIVLELIAIVITIAADKNKTILTLNAFSMALSRVYTIGYKLNNYFYLQVENKRLIESNKHLLEQSLNCKRKFDTVFSLVAANVIRNSVNYPNNILIISAGKKQGVEPDLGVISTSGNVVGTVISVTDNYATVLSVLNQITSISVLHKRSNTMGQIWWDLSLTPDFVRLTGIPLYIKVQKGDTIITSGYSQIFPKGILVGTVWSVRRSRQSNEYEIKVKLAETMNQLQSVFVVRNRDKAEIERALAKATQILRLE